MVTEYCEFLNHGTVKLSKREKSCFKVSHALMFSKVGAVTQEYRKMSVPALTQPLVFTAEVKDTV